MSSLPIPRRRLAILAAPPLFAVTAVALSLLQRDELHGWGWTVLDHHGVPWPSSLALGVHGWMMCVAFAYTGAALAALGAEQRRRALVVAGFGLLAAALPLDRPVGDPSELSAWISSWHAIVHTAGFVVAGLAGLVAVARSSRLTAVAMIVALFLPGAVGWYLFLALFLGWVQTVAASLSSAPCALGRSSPSPASLRS